MNDHTKGNPNPAAMSSMWNFNVISWAPEGLAGTHSSSSSCALRASHLGLDRLHCGSATLPAGVPHPGISDILEFPLQPRHSFSSDLPQSLCRDSTATTQHLASVSLHDSLDLAPSSSKLIPFEHYYQIPVPACDVARPPCTTAASVSLCFRRHLPGHLPWRGQEPL